MTVQIALLAAVLAALLMSGSTVALTQDEPPTPGAGVTTQTTVLGGDAPIDISADEADLRQNERMVILKGNVVALQGAMRLEAQTVRVFYAEDGSNAADPAPGAGIAGRIERLEAEGKVKLTRPDQRVEARTAVYKMGDGKIVLSGGVTSQIRKNVVQSEELTVDLNDNTVKLDSKSGNGRVHGIFVPESKNGAK